MEDAIDDAVSLFESGLLPQEEVLWLTLDFKDAFKQLPTKPTERRYLAGQADGQYFYYKTVLFGVRTGPLVWCRVAALVSRATQALTSSAESRLELFIDDPLIAMKGTRQVVHWAAARVLWFWLALGLKLAWPKGSLGTEAHWIGTVLKADHIKANRRSQHSGGKDPRLATSSCGDFAAAVDFTQVHPEVCWKDVMGGRCDPASKALCADALLRLEREQASSLRQAVEARAHLARCSLRRLQQRLTPESASTRATPSLSGVFGGRITLGRWSGKASKRLSSRVLLLNLA